MNFSLRRRLLTVAALGTVTCVFALYALGRPLGFAGRRSQQSRLGVEEEVRRLVAIDGVTVGAPQARMVGMRSGAIEAHATFDAMPSLEPEARALLARAREAATATGAVVMREVEQGDSIFFAAVAKRSSGDYAWASFQLMPPRWPLLRIVGLVLALGSIVLVAASLHAVAGVRRDAQSLQRSLRSISADLGAPIPRPAVRELGDVADGIAHLARDLEAAERERERLRGALVERERLAVLGRVTAGVAHELRNPLALIKLRVDLAVRAAGDRDAVIRELADVPDEIARLDRLVKDLLTVAGRRTGPRADVDLAELARRRVTGMQPFATQRGVAMTVSGSARASVDPDAIAQVLDNLLANATEASPRDREVRVAIAAEPGCAIIDVIDEGAGVPREREAELCEPFFTTKPEGVGLGLAVSRAIAAAHHGTLEYRRDGATTTFRLVIPTRASAEAAA